VLAGLTAGERVIVEGTQKVRDGAMVRSIDRVSEESLAESDEADESHEANAGAVNPGSIAQ
jgi:hypothetical protein